MHYVLRRAPVLCLSFVFLASAAAGQIASAPSASTANNPAPPEASAPDGDVRAQLQEQREELERLRRAISEQSELINNLRSRVERTEQALRPAAADGDRITASTATGDGVALPTASVSPQQSTPNSTAAAQTEERLKRVEAQARATSETLARQLGSITFSGDIRLQYDSIYGQINAQPNSADPTALGNELSSRQRFRIRARLALRGSVGKEFDWGLRFSTGSFPDVISSNQILTDFYTRKPFALDQVYLTYRPAALPGLRLQGGKFDAPWLHTELTFDNDIQPEGFNEQYSSTLR